MTKEELIENKNNKLRLIGKQKIYFIYNNLICIDLDKVTDINLVIPDFVEGIINNRKSIRNEKIETIKFNDNIQYIQTEAFKNLTEARYISDLDKVKGLNASSLFYWCKSLIESPLLPDYIKDMSATFFWCESLEHIKNIPNGVKIMDFTFAKCESLIKCTKIPDSVTSKDGIFSDFNNIEFY